MQGASEIVALNIGLPTLVKPFLNRRYLTRGWQPLRQFGIHPA